MKSSFWAYLEKSWSTLDQELRVGTYAMAELLHRIAEVRNHIVGSCTNDEQTAGKEPRQLLLSQIPCQRSLVLFEELQLLPHGCD